MAAAGYPSDGTIVETVSGSREAARSATLERVAAAQRSSALLLRTSGRERAARRAELAARRIAFALDQPQLTDRMFGAARSVIETSAGELRRERALDEAINLLGAGLGNIQLIDPDSGALEIVVQTGFGPNFLDHFAGVEDDTSACGRAATHGAQVVIADVDSDPAFEPHRQIAADSRFRAVQSTPFVDPDGTAAAVFSTHFREPYRPTEAELLLFDWYVDQVGGAVAADA